MTSSEHRGLEVQSYSLEIHDGQGGEFRVLTASTVVSLSSSDVITAGISQGLTYRARYRAWNAYGWSEYSPTGAILAA